MKNGNNFYGLKDPYSKFQKAMLTVKIAFLLLTCGLLNALAIPTHSGIKLSMNSENFAVNESWLSDPAQQQKVTGRVTDLASGEPLVGVNVVVQGSTIGAITDADGRYSIDLGPNEATLDFTFIGYIRKSIQVKGQAVINVQLESDLKSLDEVVVVGYGKSSKRNITGSVSTISEKEMNRGVYSSPAQMLQGKVPGLNITRSGDPTARPSITLRGPSTLRTGEAMEPFYVIDGVPGASIEAVASDDIVSIRCTA